MIILATLVLSVIAKTVALIQITHLQVPETADPRTPAELLCEFQQHGDHLQSVKWYRNDREFLYYRPEMDTPLSYSVDGIDDINSASCNTSICRLQVTVSRFPVMAVIKCEVSGEAPRFIESHKKSYMGVLALPDQPPKITGLPEHVEPDTDVTLNCSSGLSLPPAQIIWFINGVLRNGTSQGMVVSEGLYNSWSTITLSAHYKEVTQVECRWRVGAYGRKPIEKHSGVLLADDATLQTSVAQKVQTNFAAACGVMVIANILHISIVSIRLLI